MALPEKFPDRNICVIGLGYVGLTFAVAMANTGFRVHGVEIRDDVLDLLAQGRAHFWEPRLEEKLRRVLDRQQFRFSRDLNGGTDAQVYVITVGTPLGHDGKIRIEMIERATEQVAGALNNGALVVLRSTVKLGTTRDVVKPILDATGKQYDIAYCPERTLEGRALIELHELPQVIGADDPNTRWRCTQLFSLMTSTTVVVNSLEAAELVKLVDNTYRDLTFGFANEIAKLCTHAGVSALEVIRAGKLGYPRTNVPLPGPVGGPCLEKDPHILVESARRWGIAMPITSAARSTNEAQPRDVAAVAAARAAMLPGFATHPNVSLIGLAFKGVPPTDDLRGTVALHIFREVAAQFPGAVFRGFDPVVDPEAIRNVFGFEPVSSLPEAFADADLVMLLNNHPALQQLDLAHLADLMRRPGIVYDLWNLHDDVEAAMPSGVVCLALGSEQIGRIVA